MLAKTSRSHRHFSSFVDWIKPEAETREAIIEQAANIRAAISGQASADGLTVIATPNSGSFAKRTGLRRHMRGGAEIEGQDVDLPFVLRPKDEERERIDELLNRFDRYAKASYPNTPREVTASSVELRFVTSRLIYDLVPMLQAKHPDYQIILKKNGARRVTSVAKHTEFVRKRTEASEKLPGPVTFNECVRLVKWWRCVRIDGTTLIDEVRTTLLELMCASAFDRSGVQSTYTATLAQWFGWMAHLVKQRREVKFADYPSIEPLQESVLNDQNRFWRVIDPVNENNNVVHASWTNIHLTEFAEWLEDARDTLTRVIANEQAGRDSEVDRLLAELFGNAVITHGAAT